MSPTELSQPTLVVHADWGTRPGARWMALAIKDKTGTYQAQAPEPVGDLSTFFQRLRDQVGAEDTIFAGFDFVIGLPIKYAQKVGVQDFLDVMPKLGQGEWADFYKVANKPHEIGLKRPFYPYNSGSKGEKKQTHLFQALGVESIDDLRRKCEYMTKAREKPAQSLFWTLGPDQVGRGTIVGWRDLILPALENPSLDVAIWPFSGYLSTLFEPGRIVLAETYPAEFYSHLGIMFSPSRPGQSTGKTVQAERARNAPALFQWVQEVSNEVAPSSALREELKDGFGSSRDGEDRFDATVGLFGTLNVLLGHHPHREPGDEQVRNVEGWILGQGG